MDANLHDNFQIPNEPDRKLIPISVAKRDLDAAKEIGSRKNRKERVWVKQNLCRKNRRISHLALRNRQYLLFTDVE